MADGTETTKAVRVRGRNYTISLMLTTDGIICYMRLMQLGGQALTAGVGRNVKDGLEVSALGALAFAQNFRVQDLQQGGDLYPLLTCITAEGMSGNIAPMVDTMFAGRYGELLQLLKEAAAFNFPDFTGALVGEVVTMFAAALAASATSTEGK